MENFIKTTISVSLFGGEYRGRSPLCKGTGSATSLCRSRAAAIAQRSDACVTSYWVLPDAGIGRTGSKAAFLPSSALGENEEKCHVLCGQRGQAFLFGGTLERKGEDCD